MIANKRGFFGPSPWVQGRSSKIAGDMDELLMAEILPTFITIFRSGISGTEFVLPMMDEIAPLWLQLQNYVRSPEKAVSWPLAFLVQAWGGGHFCFLGGMPKHNNNTTKSSP